MPSVKVLLKKTYERKNGTYPVVIRVHAAGKDTYLYSGHAVRPGQFRDKHGQWVHKHPDALFINDQIEEKRAEAVRCIHPVMGYIPGGATPSASFTNCIRKRKKYYEARGLIVMVDKMNTTLNELQTFAGREVFYMEMDQTWIASFDGFLQKKGNRPNTIAKKLQTLRMIYKIGILEGETPGPNPFERYQVKREPVKKDKLTADEVKLLEEMKLPTGSFVWHCRNAWLFSFYAHGMRFENVCLLKKEDVKDYITYRMNKGKKIRSISIHPKMKALLSWYLKNFKGPYLFPFLKKVHPLESREFKRAKDVANVMVNTALKNITLTAGIEKNLTFHTARHTFAYLAKVNSVHTNIIKDALGHTSVLTTENYLKSLDDDLINEAVNGMY